MKGEKVMKNDVIIIPKTERRITGDYRADRLIEYVRNNGYPKWCTQKIMFENDKNYALCSKLGESHVNALLTGEQMGLYDEGSKYMSSCQKFTRFEGGWVLNDENLQWDVYVDGHLYFFDF